MLSEPNARISTRSEAFAQQLLRKPLRAGTAGAGLIAIFVNRGWPAADPLLAFLLGAGRPVGLDEIRRKSSSGGQRFCTGFVARQRRFSLIRLGLLVHVQRAGVAGPFCGLALGWWCLGGAGGGSIGVSALGGGAGRLTGWSKVSTSTSWVSVGSGIGVSADSGGVGRIEGAPSRSALLNGFAMSPPTVLVGCRGR